ncbi:acetate kinase [Leucobacter denitrificans]|uniref:Acetate kinase n=1 Tax=Leucobacter denitrificans TaxID=683042 RepID=A0A7G9S758_9MICO|nr:acetate kinase [Leucobacter denitrificans]QNN63683.1 acetate kinase [Leucobacter denitrificans]
MSAVLVVNSGSSSIKYQVIHAESGERLADGLVERIGESSQGRIEHRAEKRVERELAIPDHTVGFAEMVAAFAEAGAPIESLDISAVGHRVVHGGSEFIAPTLIDDRVAERILALAELAPLHNPGHHAAIVAARATFPELPHIAVFDTAFHQSMPESAYTYAIAPEVAAKHGVRRYGFHGISHAVVSRRAAEHLGKPVESLKQIVLHLGNGASMCAIDGGESVDTSMGLTPLEGLVMGTRSGDIDPGVIFHLLRRGETVDSIDTLLNKRSGFLGFTGSNDFRDVREAAARGDHDAKLAIDVYVHRARHYLGAYLAVLRGADTIVFTAGLGENAPDLRARVCAGFEWCGIHIDPELNEAPDRGARVISTADSTVTVLVVPTDEETEIARQTIATV